MKIPLQKSAFYNEQSTREKLAHFVATTDRFSMGEQCARFEKSFGKKQGRDYCVLVNSGSSANLALVQALLNTGSLRKGDMVGVSAVTWATNVMPLLQLGLEPIPIDVASDTLNISPQTLTPHLTKIKALFLTHVLGLSDDIETISNLCAEQGVILLEDTCESLGSCVGGKLLGNFGLASTFSFFVGHHISTIEGGMVCTDDRRLYEALLMVRAHGWERNLPDEAKARLRDGCGVDDFYARYTFHDLGYNLRPTEITGFLGNIQIEYWDDIVSRREENFLELYNDINNHPDFLSLRFQHMDVISSFAIPLVVKNRAHRKVRLNTLSEAGVETRPLIGGNIVRQPFFEKHITRKHICECADLLHTNGFYFGNNPEMTTEDIAFIKKALL